ncbi:hypothetical protein, partial [Pantoea agglomerans]
MTGITGVGVAFAGVSDWPSAGVVPGAVTAGVGAGLAGTGGSVRERGVKARTFAGSGVSACFSLPV